MAINIAQARELLEKERETLLKEIKTVGRINPDNTKDWEPIAGDLNAEQAEREERADEITSFEERSAIEFELEKRLLGVEEALSRIDKGTFGFCHTCNEPIDEKRLLVNPSATTCRTHME